MASKRGIHYKTACDFCFEIGRMELLTREYGGSSANTQVTEDHCDVTMHMHVGRPNLGDREMFHRLVDEMFDNRWFTNDGRFVQRLEHRLSESLGVNHVVLVNNGTTGLQIAGHALDLTGEIILPAFTFVATPHAFQWGGLKPVFCDVDPVTHCIDPNKIESLITDRTSAIVGVHLWGRPCQTAAIEEIADRHGLAVIYDAAHAFGSAHRERMIANFGRCEVFSFHATKFFHTFEGGAIATNDDELAHKIRLMKNFGFESMDRVVHLGINGKMPEVCAAMGLASLEQLDEVLFVNRQNYHVYRSQLADVPGIHLYSHVDPIATNFQYVVTEVDDDAAVSRDELLKRLHDANIRARRYFFPACHRMEPYRSLYPEQIDALPVTDQLCRRVLVLPTGTSISPDDVQTVCAVIRSALM